MAKRPTKCTRELECVLTRDELLEYSRQMANASQELARAEERKKSFVSQVKADIEATQALLNRMAQRISTGKETRPTDCTVTYDWEKRTMQIWRTDTGEMVSEDIIPEVMLQEHLELEGEKAHEDDPVVPGLDGWDEPQLPAVE